MAVSHIPGPSAGNRSLAMFGCCDEIREKPLRALSCKAINCPLLIEINEHYYSFEDAEHGKRFGERINICRNCYKDSFSHKYIEVRERKRYFCEVDGTLKEKDSVKINRYDFKMIPEHRKLVEPEPSIVCCYCSKRFHKMCSCVMYDEYQWKYCFELVKTPCAKEVPFICHNCFRAVVCPTPVNPFVRASSVIMMPFTPEAILHTPLSEKMETEVQNFLFMKCAPHGLPLPYILVREVSSKMIEFEAKPLMKAHLEEIGREFKWNLMQRTFIVFQQNQNLNAKEYIALFCLIVHEYPSVSAVNLAYLDSVKLFQPNCYRTEFFKRVVLSYLRCILGKFDSFHIWVCPPQPGDEYVFYGRPDEPKVRGKKIKGLINWYASLLDMGKNENIIDEYHQVGAKCNPYRTYLDIPYLMEDFWVDKFEDILKEYKADFDYWNTTQPFTSGASGRPTKRAKSASRPPACMEARVQDIMKKAVCNQLFVVKLKKPSKDFNCTQAGHGAGSNHAVERDILCDYMASRDKFIVECRENNYDFSDSRRAAYSTMDMLSKIGEESTKRNCSTCRQFCIIGKYCYICTDKAFCNICAPGHAQHGQFLRDFIVPIPYIKWTNDLKKTILKAMKFRDFLSDMKNTIKDYCYLSPTFSSTDDVLHEFKILNGNVRQPRYFHYHIDSWRQKDPCVLTEHCNVCKEIWPLILLHRKVCRETVCELPICASSSDFSFVCSYRYAPLQQDLNMSSDQPQANLGISYFVQPDSIRD